MPLLLLIGTGGTGSVTGTGQILSNVVPSIPGQTYSLSFWMDTTNITNMGTSTPQVEIGINSADGSTSLSVATVNTSGVGRIYLPNWLCPIGRTSVQIYCKLYSTATLTSGTTFKTGNPWWQVV